MLHFKIHLVFILLNIVARDEILCKVHSEKILKKLDQSDHGLLSNEALDKSTLLCPPCEQVHCQPRRPKRLHCKGGLTLGICDCCPVCAKVEGEACGGQSNYLGKCDYGLYCQDQGTQVLQYERNGIKQVYQIDKGTCKRVARGSGSSGDYPPFCRPKCTYQFCLRNPKAICSAEINAEQRHECQGPCQHTSCRACRFVQPLTPCNKCHQDDFRCIRQFGKCIRQNYCTRHKYPCKSNDLPNEDRETKFSCKVPECNSDVL